MPEKVLYSHDPAKEVIGYQVLARSRSAHPAPQLSVGKFVQELRIRAADLDGNVGWGWGVLDDRHCLARIKVLRTSGGNRLLEYRLLVFSASEAASIEYEPFHFASVMCDDSEWQMSFGGELSVFRGDLGSQNRKGPKTAETSLKLPLELPWLSDYSGLPELIARLIAAFPVGQRRHLEVRAPEVRGDGQLQIRIGMTTLGNAPPKVSARVQGNHRRAIALISLVGLFAMTTTYGWYSTWQWSRKISELEQLKEEYSTLIDELNKMKDARDVAIEDAADQKDKYNDFLVQLNQLVVQSWRTHLPGDSAPVEWLNLDLSNPNRAESVKQRTIALLKKLGELAEKLRLELKAKENSPERRTIPGFSIPDLGKTRQTLNDAIKSPDNGQVDLGAIKDLLEKCKSARVNRSPQDALRSFAVDLIPWLPSGCFNLAIEQTQNAVGGYPCRDTTGPPTIAPISFRRGTPSVRVRPQHLPGT